MQNTKKIASLTLGCKVNDYDTKAMLNLFQNNGYEVEEDFSAFADVYLINTCTVTSIGDKKSRQMIRRARLLNPNAIVVAAGCYAQVAPNEISKIEGVNIVIGNKDRNNIVNMVKNYDKKDVEINVEDLRYEKIFEELKLESMGEKTRAFVKIQEGCNEFCSYCIIPYARGGNRSREINNIITEVQNLSVAGYKEIVLTGIHVTSYGNDLINTTLIDVLKKLHDIDTLERIRLSSIEPRLITEEFIYALSKLPKICDHFHLSLQSGCDKTLKKMNRKYNTSDFERSVQLLRSVMPNVAITTDVIVGFPGEEERDFATTVSFIQNINFASMHIFPYSAKKGTRAYDFPEQISTQVKNIRAKILKDINITQRQNFIKSQTNKNLKVLYETEVQKNVYEGYSTNYIKVQTRSNSCIKNEVLNINLSNESSTYVL